MPIPKKVVDRISSRLKAFQGILEAQRARDVSEADTVTVVKDCLSELFGYDKYAEITGEHAIRGTYCDLAVKLDNKLAFLIEVKAIGIDLKEQHTKQAIDYAANQGVDWVVLTNGVEWVLYHVLFKKPIEKQEIDRFNLLTVSHRSEPDLEKLFLISKEGFLKSALAEYRDRKDATSRYMLAAILLGSDQIMGVIRREVRKVSDLLVDPTTILQMLREQVIKRDALEGVEADNATKRFQRASQKDAKKRGAGKPAPAGDAPASEVLEDESATDEERHADT
jgi:hypothetical protein